MSGFETDFITGRAINSDDRAVGIVIIPATHGYPNPIKFPASAPVYPSDRFEALSLPLNGSLTNGFFTPDQGQVALEIFEGLVGMPWSEFRTTVLNEQEGTVTIGRRDWDQETVAPGLAILHKSTADALISHAREDLDTKTAAVAAAAITMDAKRRCKQGDDKYWNVSQMNAPRESVYLTLSDQEIAVPNVSHALADMEPRLLSGAAKKAMHRHHHGAEDTDGSKLLLIYEALCDFQKMSYGLRTMRRYLEPSAFSRGDNLVSVTKFNLRVVDEAMKGFSERNGFEPESERFDESLEDIANALRSTLETVEAEMAKRNTFKM